MAIGILGLLLMVGTAAGAMLGIVAATKYGHWGVFLGISLLFAGTVAALIGWSFQRVGVPTNVVQLPALPAIQGIANVPTAPGVPGVRFAGAEVASDAELEGIASAEPQIDLGDIIDEPVVDKDRSRPDWIENPTEGNQRVLTTDPYATVESCEASAWLQLLRAVGDRAEIHVDYLGSDIRSVIAEVKERFVEDRYLEKREVSVGEVYLMHTLVSFDDDSIAWLKEQSVEWRRDARRKVGVQNLALGGGGILAFVALLHGWLRSGGKRSS